MRTSVYFDAQSDEVALRTEVKSGDRMLELIEVELTKVRRMAEQAGNGLLLSLLDMAILEANAQACAVAGPTEHENQVPDWELWQQLRVVR